MNIAVIGDTGMFGSELIALLNERGITARGFNRSNLELEKSSIEDLGIIFSGFDVIVNAVAYTAVDKAELEIYEAHTVNAIFAGKLAQAAAIAGAKFVHISTDYVFDGTGTRPYKVTDQVDPQNEYGRSKALGEQLVAESGADYTIFRTAWLYGKFGRCFPKIIASVIDKNGSARVVDDQIGQPTWTRDLAEQVLAYSMLENSPKIVHGVSSGRGSWADFAQEVSKSLGLEGSLVSGIPSSEYPTPARRPSWSVLDNSSDLVAPIGDWRERWLIAAEEVLGSR
jgi:dTDP-4-dehydrorhamnose reductase